MCMYLLLNQMMVEALARSLLAQQLERELCLPLWLSFRYFDRNIETQKLIKTTCILISKLVALNKANPILFLHIGKSGGTSFDSAARRWIRENDLQFGEIKLI